MFQGANDENEPFHNKLTTQTLPSRPYKGKENFYIPMNYMTSPIRKVLISMCDSQRTKDNILSTYCVVKSDTTLYDTVDLELK